MTTSDLPLRNGLLRRLDRSDLDSLALVPVNLYLRQELEVSGTPSEFVYFIEDGLASVVFEASMSGATEIGLIGPEGMTGLTSIYGDDLAPFTTFMQIEGSALRCGDSGFRELMAERPIIRSIMLRYARAFSIQVACTAVANGRANLEERLARWLLMVEDRVGETLHITHEFIAIMMAVRRSGVTLGIQNLEGKRLIQATRGSIRILDRRGLIEAAHGSYGLAESEYARLLGKPL